MLSLLIEVDNEPPVICSVVTDNATMLKLCMDDVKKIFWKENNIWKYRKWKFKCR